MKVESLRLKNYRAFRDVSITGIPPFGVFIGANGTGKSTLFDVFGFLRDALRNNVRQALSVRGGFNEVRSRDAAVGSAIEIAIQMYMPITGKDRLVTYELEIVQPDSEPQIRREVLRYKRGSYGSPFHFLDFAYGEGTAVTNEEDFDKEDEELSREFQSLDSPDILAIKGVGQFKRFQAANAFRSLIENWHVSDFHITEARRINDAGYAEHLSPSGDNLALVAQYIHESHPDIFQKIISGMRQRVPGIDGVEPRVTDDGRLVLRFRDGSFEDPFISRFVSDGTIKMFAYLTLLYDPRPHPLLCVEEPENQLYVNLLPELAEEFETYAGRGGQVFVSTHTPDFLNAVPLESIFWIEKHQGFSHILKASDNENLRSLVNQGDPPGYLWKQGLFGQVDPP